MEFVRVLALKMMDEGFLDVSEERIQLCGDEQQLCLWVNQALSRFFAQGSKNRDTTAPLEE